MINRSVVFLLFAGLLIFSAATIFCALRTPDNDKLYVFLTGVAGNFSGALLTYLQIKKEG